MTQRIEISMSSAGHCPRALSAELLYVPTDKAPPAYLKTAADEGNLHEDALKAKLRADGFNVEDSRVECEICKARHGTGRMGIHVEIDLQSILLVGHMDGRIIRDTGEKDKLECKSMSQYQFDKWMKSGFNDFKHYADQLTCYGEADKEQTRNRTYYIVKNRNSGYVNKTYLLENPSNFDDIKARLFVVASYVLERKIAPAEYNPNSQLCNWCGYKSLCIPEPTAMTPATIEELKTALATRELAKITEREQLGIARYQETIIKNYMLKNNNLKMRFAGWVMSLTPGMTRTTYSKASLIEAGVTEEQLNRAANIGEPFDNLYLKNLNKDED